MLVSLNKERQPCWCPKIELYTYAKVFFCFGWKTCSLIMWVQTLYYTSLTNGLLIEKCAHREYLNIKYDLIPLSIIGCSCFFCKFFLLLSRWQTKMFTSNKERQHFLANVILGCLLLPPLLEDLFNLIIWNNTCLGICYWINLPWICNFFFWVHQSLSPLWFIEPMLNQQEIWHKIEASY